MLGAGANGSSPSSPSSKPSLLEGKVRFGCAAYESGLIFQQKADGLLGLSKARVSVLNQLASASKVPGANAFAVCASPTSGFLAIGQGTTAEEFPFCEAAVVRVPYMYNRRIKRKHLYAVALKSMAVGAAMVGGNAGGHDRDHPPVAVVVDTGSTLSYLPEGMHAAFVSRVDEALPAGSARAPRQLVSHRGDVCYTVGRDTRVGDFPQVRLSFSSGGAATGTNANASPSSPNSTLALGPQAYLYQQTNRLRQKMYCLLFHPSKASEALLGSVMLENVLVGFDNNKHLLSFRRCRCDQWAQEAEERRASGT